MRYSPDTSSVNAAATARAEPDEGGSRNTDLEDPFRPSAANTSALTQSNTSTSYTIMSPRAFSAILPLPGLISQKGSQEGIMPTSNTGPARTEPRRDGRIGSTIEPAIMNLPSPSSVVRAVSPPTPAPSPQPDLDTHVHSPGSAVPSSSSARHATPSHSGSGLMTSSGSTALGEPGTPVTPGTENANGLGWGDPNARIHPSHFVDSQHGETFHVDPQVQDALFAEQFIQSVASYFPRLTGTERQTLFTSLLPYMSGEDLLHLSHLISPYLRRDFLSELPAEVALKILAFIDDPKDLMRASRVSRTWRSLVADEHNWKLMLEKYNGGGWSEARPALSSTSAIHPTSAGSGQTRNQRGAPMAARVAANQQPAAYCHAAQSRILDPVPPQTTGWSSFSRPQPCEASTSTSTRNSASGEDNVNRFIQGSSTPLANRTRKGKGKSRAFEEDGGGRTNTSPQKDLSAAGSPELGMSGTSSSGTIGLMTASLQGASANQDPQKLHFLHGLGVIPSQRGGQSMMYHASPSAASVLATGTTASLSAFPSMHTLGPQVLIPYLPILGQSLPNQLQQLSLGSNAPPRAPTISIPALALPEAITGPSPIGPSNTAFAPAVSPGAPFATAYSSPAQVTTVVPAVQLSTGCTSATPSVVAEHHTSPIPNRSMYQSSGSGQHPQSAPQPTRVRIAKSQNPFGSAQTNLTYTSQYAPNKANSTATVAVPSKPFSFKTQFKKAYLTESNWLKGPGRVLSRQTCTDDGVVTSLGFDNEWIIVGMATNQIHVFDAKTGAYVRQLVGHTLGVWCLVLVSMGGQRLDKDGRKVKNPNAEGAAVPSVFGSAARTTPDASDEEDESTDPDEGGSDSSTSPTPFHFNNSDQLRAGGMERTRSASAGPANREMSFKDIPGSSMSNPHFGLNAGSSQADVRADPRSYAQRSSSTSNSSDPPKRPKSTKRPSSFNGVPATDAASAHGSAPASATDFSSNPSGFPFGGIGAKISSQQAAACGTAQGWGQAGAVAVSGGCDRDVRVWDVATGRCIHTLRGHLSTVRCLKVLDGRPIAVSGSRDNTLRVWDIERGVLLKLLSGHQHSVRCIEISGNKVVSGSYDATCKIWDVDTGECLHTLQGHQHQIYAVAFDGNRVASGSLDSTVRIWSAKTGECLALLQGHTSLVGQLQLTDSLLVTGGSDGRVIVFSLSTFECLHRLCAHDNSVTCLQFNDRFMVTGGNDGRVKLWDRPTGKLIRDLAEPCEAVWRVTFREDKCVLLCKRGNRTIMEVRTFAPFDEEL